jgi:hypothetical protein
MDKGWAGKSWEESAEIVRNLLKKLDKQFEEKAI